MGREEGRHMKKTLLLTPGPTPVPEDVLEAMARPMIHHRHEPFRAVIEKVKQDLKVLFQTKNEVLILGSTGTGAMEGAVSNVLSRGDKAIVVRGGKFGERWGEICEAYGVQAIPVDVEWGKAVDAGQVRTALDQAPDAKAVFLQASETSTGVKHPVREIADLVAARENTVIVVDAITALGVFDIPTDAWKLDVVVTGSQKALMLPPGLAFACLSEKAWRLAKESDLPKYYFDFAKEKKNLEKNQTAYTSSVSLIMGLEASLERIKQEGLKNLFARTEKLARATREGVKALGLELFAPESPSEACTAIKVPEGIDGAKIPTLIREKYGVAIAGGQAHLKGKIVRISHMGYVNTYDILSGLAALEFVLKDLGYPVETGASVRAAMAVLAP
jgi:aspartate aminotransferase-like enzyme